VAAYDDLPESLRQLANHLRAVHTNQYDYGPSLSAPFAVPYVTAVP
jgi:alpha-ketoglutarate-dependent taurine dioxygenase